MFRSKNRQPAEGNGERAERRELVPPKESNRRWEPFSLPVKWRRFSSLIIPLLMVSPTGTNKAKCNRLASKSIFY